MDDALARGSAHARNAIEFDRLACASGEVEKFLSAEMEYDRAVKALEPLAGSSTVVRAKVEEYAARKVLMRQWIDDYEMTVAKEKAKKRAVLDEISRLTKKSSLSDPVSVVATESVVRSTGSDRTRRRTSSDSNRPAHAFDVAFGVLFAGILFLLLYFALSLFRPYLLPALMAGIFSVALRPLRTGLVSVLKAEPIFGSGGKKKLQTILTDLGSPRNLVAIAVVIALLLIRNTRFLLSCVAMVTIFGALGALILIQARFLVRTGILDGHTASTGIVMACLAGSCLFLLGFFAIGTAKDVTQGFRDLASLSNRLITDASASEMVAQRINETELTVREAINQNRHVVQNAAVTVQDFTGLDFSEATGILFSEEPFSIGELKTSVVQQLPGSVQQCRALGTDIMARLKNKGFDTSKYQEHALTALRFIGSGAGDVFQRLGDIIEKVGSAVTFFGLLPLLLTRERSIVTILTDLLPLPSRSHSVQLSHDLDTAITAILWSLVMTFLSELSFVFLLFHAFRLNFEYLSAFLSGIGAAVPFFPSGITFTMLLGVPQLIPQKRWLDLALLVTLHLLFQSSLSGYMELCRGEMVMGSPILDRKLFSLSVLLSLPLFARKSMIFGPGVVAFATIFYEVYHLLNREKFQRSILTRL